MSSLDLTKSSTHQLLDSGSVRFDVQSSKAFKSVSTQTSWDDIHVSYQGYMEKKGHWNTTMRRRYFVLSGTCLRYFEEKGTIDVRGSKVLEENPSDTRLLSIHDPARNRTWQLIAETADQREQWKIHITRAAMAKGSTQTQMNKRPTRGKSIHGSGNGGILELTYENQKKDPSSSYGWSSSAVRDRFPWSSADGQEERTLESVELPDDDDLEWEWAGNWYINTSTAGCDEEGWLYATDFESNHWGENKKGCNVRRREWHRLRMPRKPSTPRAVVSSSESFCDLPWQTHFVSKLAALSAAVESFVDRDTQKRWLRRTNTCDSCAGGILEREELVLICKHYLCNSCFTTLLAQQREYNKTNLVPEIQQEFDPVICCPQCYTPTFLTQSAEEVDDHGSTQTKIYRVEEARNKRFLFILEEKYENERRVNAFRASNLMGSDRRNWTKEDGTPYVPLELDTAWVWLMDWKTDKTRPLIDSLGWQYAYRWPAPGTKEIWTPNATNAFVRSRRHVRLRVCPRDMFEERTLRLRTAYVNRIMFANPEPIAPTITPHRSFLRKLVHTVKFPEPPLPPATFLTLPTSECEAMEFTLRNDIEFAERHTRCLMLQHFLDIPWVDSAYEI